MPMTLGWRVASIRRSGVRCPSSFASCGWTPTEHQILPWRSAMARTLLELVEPRADGQHAGDAGRAGARQHARLVAGELGEVEMAVAVDQHQRQPSQARRSAGTRPAAWAAPCPARSSRSKAANARSPGRHGELVEDLARRVGHEGLHQQGHAPDRLGQHPQHRVAPHRIGLGERPRRLGVDIAVGVGDHFPDRGQRAMEGLLVELGAHDRPAAPWRGRAGPCRPR